MSLRRRRVAHADYDASGETAVMHDEQCSFPTAGGTCLGDVWPEPVVTVGKSTPAPDKNPHDHPMGSTTNEDKPVN